MIDVRKFMLFGICLLHYNILAYSNIAMASTIDLKSFSEPGVYDVGFCARETPKTKLPGHAFVFFSTKSDSGKRNFFSIGHTVLDSSAKGTVGATWSFFEGTVGGYLKEEIYTSSTQMCLVVTVNKDVYVNAKKLSETPLTNLNMFSKDIVEKDDYHILQVYKLGSNDCIDFVVKVANLLSGKGLKVPTRNTLETPMGYITRLISTNKVN